MSTADKDGRMAQIVSDLHACLGISLNEGLREAKASFADHDHREYVEGCVRCDLSRAEVDDAAAICGARSLPLALHDDTSERLRCVRDSGHDGLHDSGDGRHWTQP